MSTEPVPHSRTRVLSAREAAHREARAHRPPWPDRRARASPARLGRLPGLVSPSEVAALRSALAEVAAGRRLVVQAGGCAEPFTGCAPGHVSRKAALLDRLGAALGGDRPAVRAALSADRFPTSRPTGVADGVEPPMCRGDPFNAPPPDVRARRADPARSIADHHAARTATQHLRQHHPGCWTSQEALVLEDELPLVRHDDRDVPLLTSTHWPWIGDRARDVEGAHVRLLASVANPVACEVGPDVRADELRALCERLDPDREPGRLTLIARLGADRVSALLPPLVAAIRAAGHPVIWLCDPLRGNAITEPDGGRTRPGDTVDAVVREVADFLATVHVAGGVAGGLRLETKSDEVDGDGFRTGVDPSRDGLRLDPGQALAAVAVWRAVRF